jgi:hypothetical protein
VSFNPDYDDKEFDVYVPDNVPSVSLSDISFNFGSETNYTYEVTLDPPNGEITANKPCVATVTAYRTNGSGTRLTGRNDSNGNVTTWVPYVSQEYKIFFGHTTGEWENDQDYCNDPNYRLTGYSSHASVRFSPGGKYRVIQAYYDASGKLVRMYESTESIPENGSGRLSVETPSEDYLGELSGLTLKRFLWDENWVPVTPTRNRAMNYYKLVKSITPGKSYIVVNVATGRAMAHKTSSITAAGGQTTTRTGHQNSSAPGGNFPISIVDDQITTAPYLLQDNLKWVFDVRYTHPNPGTTYTKANGYTYYTIQSFTHGTNQNPFTMYRDATVSSGNGTNGLNTSDYILDNALDRAQWFVEPIDPVTGETTIFSYTAGTTPLTFLLLGNNNGWVAEGGTDTLASYKASKGDNVRVRLYEYVTD